MNENELINDLKEQIKSLEARLENMKFLYELSLNDNKTLWKIIKEDDLNK